MDVLERIAGIGILPVIKIEELARAVPLADALRRGGVNAIEVTARSEAAFDAIGAIKQAFPDMAVGAGTILSAELVDRAIDAGADFCVSPGFNPRTVSHCIGRGIPIVPGCASCSDMELAAEAGLETVKFFPAEQNGGADALKLISGPFPKLRFVPTGGLNFGNIVGYLRLPSVAACGGSFMAKAEWIRAENWEAVTDSCRKALELSLGLRLESLTLSEEGGEETGRTALLDSMFPGRREAGSGQQRAAERGSAGELLFSCTSLRRVKAFLCAQSIAYEEEAPSENGGAALMRLREGFGGFAVCIQGRGRG